MAEPLGLSLGDLGRLWGTVFPAPWGPLNPVWEHVQRTAAPLDFDHFSVRQWLNYALVPFIPVAIMAYLIVGGPNDKLARETREVRLALGIVGVSIATSAYLNNRFYDLRWCCYNSMFGILYWQLVARYASLALVKEPIVDPYMGRGRPRWVAALDLVMNQRHIGLGNVGLDSGNGPDNKDVKLLSPGGKGKAPEMPYIARHLQHWRRFPRPTSRWASSLRHLYKTLALYTIMDTVFSLTRTIGPHAIAPPGGLPLIEKYGHIMAGWLAESEGVLLPSTLRVPLPKWLMSTFMELIPPLAIWGFLTVWYHFVAFLCIASGYWEPEVWDIDVFDAPLKSTSLMQLWGRRWHQVFRHTFVDATESVLRILHLPNNLVTFYPLIYLFSGLLHAMGEITADPVPRFSHVMAFFMLSGVGCSLEIAAKRVLGVRTRGLLGWCWTWTWTAVTGRLVANAWIDAGMGACSFFPDQGVGQYLAPFIMKHVYMIYHVPPAAEVAPVITDAAQALLATPSVVESLAEVISLVAESTRAALTAATAAVTETLAAVAEPSAVFEAASEVAEALSTEIVAAAAEATEAVAGAVSESVVEAVSESVGGALSEVVTDNSETLATTLVSALIDTTATAAALTKAAVENLSTIATAVAEPAEVSTVRFITVDSVPAHIVEAALATASAAMSAALEESTATS